MHNNKTTIIFLFELDADSAPSLQQMKTSNVQSKTTTTKDIMSVEQKFNEGLVFQVGYYPRIPKSTLGACFPSGEIDPKNPLICCFIPCSTMF